MTCALCTTRGLDPLYAVYSASCDQCCIDQISAAENVSTVRARSVYAGIRQLWKLTKDYSTQVTVDQRLKALK